MFIPTRPNYTEMTPTEFEKYTIDELKRQFNNIGIQNYSFEHNVIKKADDGTYQIDGEIKLTIMGAIIDILVECKLYKSKIKRSQIQVLHEKIKSIGAHKGIFVTTSSFQSGAIKYATKRGIALISIVNGEMRFDVRSRDLSINVEPPPWVDYKPYSMALQFYNPNGSISVSYLDSSKELFDFITDN